MASNFEAVPFVLKYNKNGIIAEICLEGGTCIGGEAVELIIKEEPGDISGEGSTYPGDSGDGNH